MKRTHDKKPNQSITSAKPTTLNLQTRPFAPLQSDSSQDYEITDSASTQAKGIASESMLERLISTSKPESAVPIQRKPHNHLKSLRIPIQAKLSIGEPNDKYEQEADATAAKVVQQINAPQNQSIQRQGSMEEEDELQMKSLVQRRENIGGGEASTDLESSIQRARGSGQSLDARLKAKMGQAMGADFNNVKVHTDSQSDQLNKSIQAKAFTTGQDVFFRQGAYDPSSRGGQELIAHELTHVVQQGSAGRGLVQRKEGDTVNGVVQKKPAEQTGKLYIKTGDRMIWYNLPEGSDVKEGDQVEFTEGANRAVINLNVTKKMRTDIDPSKMNSTQLFNAFYGLMRINAPAIFVSKYKCGNEDGTTTYSKEYKFSKIPEDIILHIHWHRKSPKGKIDVAKAHVKKQADRLEIGKSTGLTISELKALKIPLERGERLFDK